MASAPSPTAPMRRLSGRLVRDEVPLLLPQLAALLAAPAGSPLLLDLSHITAVDSCGAALLADFARRAAAAARPLQIRGLHPAVARTLQLLPAPPPLPAVPPPRIGLRAQIGGWVAATTGVGSAYLRLCWAIAGSLLGDLRHRRGMRWTAITYEMATMGSQALGVAGLIALLVGVTVALQSAVQLRQFGANLYVADLMGVAITRELGPLMTAIVVAGRSGSAVAAELATMVIAEEIDALVVMGLSPIRLVVAPKVVAITLTQPLLTAVSGMLAILGGFAVAVLYLDVAPDAFWSRLQGALYLKDIATGLFKSVLFANIIVSIGAFCGLRTVGGADAVGRSTTRSVVAALFTIIVADAACSLLFYFGK